MDDAQCQQHRQHGFLHPPGVWRTLARERWVFRLRMVRRPERARGPARSKRQPPAARARDLRPLCARLQCRVSGLAARSGSREFESLPTGSPYTDTANWNSLSSADKEIINRILANYGKAIEAYLRRLVSRDAPFDRFVAGDHHAISHEARQGLKLFIGKAGCIHCHNTPLFSDDDFHVIGLRIDTSLSPHADPTETGRTFNQALICNSSVADGDFNVNGHFSDDPATTRDGTFL